MTEAEVEAKIQAALNKNATALDLSQWGLKTLPESLSRLTQLQVLLLDKNQLRELPDWIGNLTQLQVLHLARNQLIMLPESIGKLTQLQELFLHMNPLHTLPDSLSNLTQLQCLDLAWNQLQTPPEWIGNLTQIQVLYLNNNHWQGLPRSIGNLTRLRQLCLQYNQLRTVPQELSNLNQLEHLILSGNDWLTNLPPSLRLWTLDVSGCTRLSSLPDDLVVTESLELADTAITSIPASAKVAEIRWRGVPIDQRIAFHPETITYEEMLAEWNTEKRRVLLERMGIERFMREAQPEILDTDHDPGGERQLLRIELKGDEPLVCLSVIDPSTGRQYMLRVPPTMISCQQAAAWVAGFDNPDDYHPLVET